MKTGDIFHKMRPIQRLRHVMTRRYVMQEVYSSPDEVIADLSILFSELDSISASRNQIALDYRRLHKGRDELINGITSAFKQFEYLYKAVPDLPILYECPPNSLDKPISAVDAEIDGQITGELVPLIRTALSQIASTSPVMRMKPDGTEQRCIHCRVLIDLARETLGHQPWPAAPGTAVEPLLVLTDATQL